MTDAKGLSEENARLKQGISRLEEMYDMAASVHRSTWGNIINICNLVDPRVPRKPGEERPDFQAVEQVRMLCREHTALAERLKSCEEERDEWERHLHIERREHQKAIEERDRARAEVERLKGERQADRNLTNALADERCRCFLERAENAEAALVEATDLLKSCDFGFETLEDRSRMVAPEARKRIAAFLEAQAALKETP